MCGFGEAVQSAIFGHCYVPHSLPRMRPSVEVEKSARFCREVEVVGVSKARGPWPAGTSQRARKMIPLVFTLALTAACSSSGGTSSQGGDTLQRLRDAGVVKVAIANNPPYTIVEPSGDITGMIPDLVKAVMSKLGVPEVQGVVTTYDAMISGLNAHRFDLVAAGLFLTPDRCKEILFSDPDTVTVEGLAVPKGNPKNIHSFDDFVKNQSLKVALLAGGNTVEIARNIGVPSSQIVQLPNQQDGFEAVVSGRVDAYGSPVVLVTPQVQQQYDVEPVALEDVPSSASGVGFRSSDSAFRDAYNKAFRELKDDGTFESISKRWNFDAQLAMNFDAAEVSPACASS
jgi:polar amino acid transport system substrate-binding protein